MRIIVEYFNLTMRRIVLQLDHVNRMARLAIKPGVNMCHPPPVAVAKPTKTRSCKWVYGAFTSRELLVNDQPAPLTISVGEETWYYHVHLLADGTYTLTHIRQDGSGFEDYHIDARITQCTCPASKYRRQACKHVLALRAALKWLEANV